MRSYLRTTVEFCRDKGYVQTINGRRRYLPSITSTQPYSRTVIRAGYDFCLLPISNFSVSSIISSLCNENLPKLWDNN
jgi:hypothetical protein